MRSQPGEVGTHRWIPVALVALYLVIVTVQASIKTLWVDELITFYIARQPGLAGIWQALHAGADPNPPLTHILVKLSSDLFGTSALALRAPSIMCVLLAIGSMWWILRRWLPPTFAAAGILAFMATRGFDYAYDARSYAPMMGFGIASLAAWLASCDELGRRRLLAYVAMAIALAAGISSNYYCVLAFFPIATGELVRSWSDRRMRLGAWIAMLAGSLPLLAYLPLIRHNIAEFGPHAWNRPRPAMIAFSYLELVEGVFWPVLAMAICAVLKRAGMVRLQRYEAAAVVTLLLYPVFGFAIAIAGAGMISPRCVSPVCCGFGLAAGLLGERLFGHSRRAAAAMIVVLLLWVGVRESICGYVLFEQRRAFMIIRDQVAQDQTRGPILVADSSFVLPFYFYSAPDVQKRIIFPVDFAAIHRYERDDSGEENIWAGRKSVFPFEIPPALDGLARAPAVYIGRPGGWLAADLLSRGWTFTAAAENPAWSNLGGVFTPLAHGDTRMFIARPIRP